MVKLSLKNACKTYEGGNGAVEVLKHFTLDVNEGEIVCILGPSGCGKSTLLRLMAGFEEVDSGTISSEGKKVIKPDISRLMLFQDFNQLFPWKTVLENVIFPLKQNRIGASNNERRERAIKYIEMVELTKFKDNYPYQLSGGMKQKAVLARALALGSHLLLMDEPFGSLDSITRAALQKMLLKIWGITGITIVFVTHDINEALQLADRIVVMHKNRELPADIIRNTLSKECVIKEERFAEIYNSVHGLLER